MGDEGYICTFVLYICTSHGDLSNSICMQRLILDYLSRTGLRNRQEQSGKTACLRMVQFPIVPGMKSAYLLSCPAKRE